jgi:hypothetical protein
VDETTATLPAGWRDRLVPVRNASTRGATGWCLEVHDLLIAKTVAGREKDRVFLGEAARMGLADEPTLLARLRETALDDARRETAGAAIAAAFRSARPPA